MRELVYECAHAVGASRLPLVRTGIARHGHTVVCRLIADAVLDIPGMGPYRLGRTAGCLAASGIEDEHVVDLAVAVAVILGEIDDAVELVACLLDHIGGVLVVAGPSVAAIIRAVLAQCHGAVDVKLRGKLPLGRLGEEIDSRPGALIVREAGLVEHAVKIVVGIVERHLDILILDQDDESLLLAHGGEMRAGEETGATCPEGCGRERRRGDVCGLRHACQTGIGPELHGLEHTGHVDSREILL